jgi:hypothetical protein
MCLFLPYLFNGAFEGLACVSARFPYGDPSKDQSTQARAVACIAMQHGDIATQ